MEKKQETAIKNLTEDISKLKNKKINIYFCVIDTKGVPSGTLSYIYQTAYQVKELGYSVKMLYIAEKEEFIGVSGWLGDKYAEMPHFNLSKDKIEMSSADILFIPELYSNIMALTKQLPCKRIVLLTNFRYLTDIIKPGWGWEDYGIRDCLTTSENMKERILDIFPNVRTNILKPYIDDSFTYNGTKKMIINIVSKDMSDTNAISKVFFLKYPIYKWVAVRDIRNLPKSEFAKAVAEGVMTVWMDTVTDFGYSALEAMKANSIVVGKVPENIPDWMVNEKGELIDNGLWFYKNRDVHDRIAGVIESFLYDGVPQVIYDNMKKTVDSYTKEEFVKNLTNYLDELIDNRTKELTITLNAIKNMEEKA